MAVATLGVIAPVAAALSSATVTGLAGGRLGDVLKSAAVAGATAFAFNAVGDFTGHTPAFASPAHAANIAGHAGVGCLSAVASGGKCGPGALSGAAGSFASPLLRAHFQNPETNPADLFGGTAAHAAVGGLASVAGGGKFENGAVTAAFGYLFNDVALACRPVAGVGPHHCGLFVYEGDRQSGEVKAQFSLQGYGVKFDPQDSSSSTFLKDRRAFESGPNDRIIPIAPPTGMSQSDFDASVIRHGNEYDASKLGYRLGGQTMPNSNSAATAPIYRSGGSVPEITFSAPGIRYYRPK